MYSVPQGRPFAGVYFGNQAEAAEEHKLDLDYYGASPAPDGAQMPATASGANQALFAYLGNPVEPPAPMDARYTKEGMVGAIELAAKNAGIKVKKLEVDDSEYPFLVGVIHGGGSDAVKLKNQIKKLDGYEYNGSVGNDANSDGSDTCNVFCIVPYPAQPQESRRQISHRLMLRQQMFHHRLSADE